MPHVIEILDMGTPAGTQNVRVVVRSWPSEADRQAGTRQREETHDFGPGRLAATRTVPIRDEAGRYKLKTGEFVDPATLVEEVEVTVIHPTKGEFTRRVKEHRQVEFETETVDGRPHEELMTWLHNYYAHLYASDSKDTRRPIEDTDPLGVFAHPGMAALKAQVRAKHPRPADQGGR